MTADNLALVEESTAGMACSVSGSRTSCSITSLDETHRVLEPEHVVGDHHTEDDLDF